MTHDDALRLQSAIDAILTKAATEPGAARHAMGAINWGDLGCTEIEERRSLLHPGDPWVVAIIEEASPDAVGLKKYVGDRLDRPDIVIETEW